jgi:hypothetical protein
MKEFKRFTPVELVRKISTSHIRHRVRAELSESNNDLFTP